MNIGHMKKAKYNNLSPQPILKHWFFVCKSVCSLAFSWNWSSSSLWDKAWVQFWGPITPRPASWWCGQDCRRTACCCNPWAVFQCYLVVSEHHIHLPTLADHPGYATHFHSVVLLKSAWEPVAQPSCDCRHFEPDKPASNYFLDTW